MKIRQLGYRGIIIGITGNALDDDVKDFMNHGADKVLPKPFDLVEFKGTVLSLFREKKQGSTDNSSIGMIALRSRSVEGGSVSALSYAL